MDLLGDLQQVMDGLLDALRREVTQNGKPVSLTLKEFDLLKFLMQHAGQAMTRNEILDSVWGYSYAGETRTLDMHIRSLRQKLGESAGDHGFLSTVRGIGYKFNP